MMAEEPWTNLIDEIRRTPADLLRVVFSAEVQLHGISVQVGQIICQLLGSAPHFQRKHAG